MDTLLDGVIARMITLHPEMKFSIQKPGNGGLKVDADAALLEQALTNILANAVDACHGKGNVNVLVGTSRHFTETVRLNRQVEKPPSRQFGKRGGVYPDHIRDNGPGIPRKYRIGSSSPSSPRKRPGPGSGFPLAQKIVHAHGAFST